MGPVVHPSVSPVVRSKLNIVILEVPGGAVQRKLQREGVIGAADADGIFRWLAGSETRVYSMRPLAGLTVLGELRTREVRRYTFDNLDIPAADPLRSLKFSSRQESYRRLYFLCKMGFASI